MRNLKALTILAVLTVAQTLTAQEVAGRLDGRVLTLDRLPVAGAEVSATSPVLPGRRTTTTDARGRFLISALPVGPYRVEVRRVGLGRVVLTVPVRLGETTRLGEIVLTSAAAVQLAEVVVTADARGFDANNTSNRVVLDAARLNALPLERNFRETMLLAPSAVPSFLGRNGGGAGINRDAVNIAGATGYENTYFVDGINITSPIRGETSIDLPYNFIQQMDVRTGGATADDAQALGGVVNIVTPSGGDRLRTHTFAFFANNTLESAARPVSGFYQTGFTFYDAGLSVSGPLLNDRFRFFAAYNRNHENRAHTYSFGRLQTTKQQDLFAGKLTWQAGPRTSGFLTILGDPTRSEPLAMPLFDTGVPLNAEALQRKDRARGLGISARAVHTLSSTAMLEGSLSQMTRLERGEPASPAGWAPVVIDHLNGTVSGGHGLAYRFDARRRTARADLSWERNSHLLKAGAQYEELYGDITIDISRSGAGGTIDRADTNLYSWHSNLQRNGRGYNRNPALYVQDAWEIHPRLSANAGLRWSRQELRGVAATSANDHFTVRDGLQPRASLVFRPGVIGTQRAFLTYARSVEQVPAWLFQQFAAGAESLLVFRADPRRNPSTFTIENAGTNGAGSPSDTKLRAQATDHWSLGYDRRFGSLVFGVVGTRRALRHALSNGLDTNFADIFGNPGEGAMTQFPRMTRTYEAAEATVELTGDANSWLRFSYALSRTRGNYPGLYLSDWQLGVPNYGPTFILPQQYANATGLLPNDRTHVVKAFGSRQLSPTVAIGGSLLVASGTPLTEYGAIVIPPPFRGFASTRGTAGRTPMIWDLGVRASYGLPFAAARAWQSRVLLDVQHLGSPRTRVDLEQWHYTCLDGNGNQACPNSRYGEPTQYLPPMMVRLGIETNLGRSR